MRIGSGSLNISRHTKRNDLVADFDAKLKV